jgi:hypothetical protein
MTRKIDAMHRCFGTCPGFCRDCDNLIDKLWDKRYYKCAAYGDSNSEATDWRLSWTACGMLNQPIPDGFVTVVERLKHEPRPKEPEPELEGQIDLFSEVQNAD